MLASTPRSLLAWFSVASCPGINHQLCSPQRETHRNTQLIHPSVHVPSPPSPTSARLLCVNRVRVTLRRTWNGVYPELVTLPHSFPHCPYLVIPIPGPPTPIPPPAAAPLIGFMCCPAPAPGVGPPGIIEPIIPVASPGSPGCPPPSMLASFPISETGGGGGVVEKDLRSDPTCSSSCRNFVVFYR